MRIVFMGSPDFAIPSLDALYHSEHEVAAVVSNVDKRRGRGGKKRPTPVKKRARELNLPVVEVDRLDDPAFESSLRSLNADLFVVVAFRILPENILNIPRLGAVNLHASLLPKYRGAAPIHWAVINGEKETGCTIFFIEQKVDTGKIIQQKSTPIGENETTGEVYNRLKVMGADLLLRAVDDIDADQIEATPQNDEEATPAPKLFRDDCRIDFTRPAKEVHNKIRGLSPFPTAWAELDDEKFNLYRSRLGPDLNLANGKMEVKGGELLAGCGQGTVILEEVQPAGKKRMSGIDFMNGYQGEALLE